MPREARKKANSGIYHVMLRGADRRIIFSDEEDCRQFLGSIRRAKEKSGFNLYAYCLMGNHVHMLMQEGDEPLESVFKRVGASYVYYYNWKYQLRGHLFQDRFRSEVVDNDRYFLDVLRYICQNPVKAGLSKSPFEYPWLGCGGIMKKDGLLDKFSTLTEIEGYDLRRFVSEPYQAEHLEDVGPKRLTDQEAIERLRKACGCREVQDIGGWNEGKRDTAIQKALKAGVSIRQLSRLTGISKTLIERVKRVKK